jgi:hypothetical protein
MPIRCSLRRMIGVEHPQRRLSSSSLSPSDTSSRTESSSKARLCTRGGGAPIGAPTISIESRLCMLSKKATTEPAASRETMYVI